MRFGSISAGLREPALFFPTPELPQYQRQGEEKGDHIGDGGCQQRPIETKGLGQQQRQGNQHHSLPDQGNGQGLHGSPNPLEKGGSGHVNPVEEKGQHVNPEDVLAGVQVHRVP